MAATELGGAIDDYLGEHVTLQQLSERATKLGFLMVPRLGANAEYGEMVLEVGDNKQLVGELGLPPNSGLILATNQLPEAVAAAVGGSESHDPLAPQKGDFYGWGRFDDNDDPGDVWISSKIKPLIEGLYGRMGRLVFVSQGSFRERSDYPGHFFTDASELPSHDMLLIGKKQVAELAAGQLLSWREVQR